MVPDLFPTVVCAAPAIEVLAGLPTLPNLLNAHQAQRRRAFVHQRDADAFLAARALTAHLWSFVTGTAAESFQFSQQCPRCGGPHGPPTGPTPGLGIGWSHSDDLAAGVVGRSTVAVDVESGRNDPPPLVTGGGTTAERLRRWTLAECLTKSGHGSLDDCLQQVRTGSPITTFHIGYWNVPVAGVTTCSLTEEPAMWVSLDALSNSATGQ